VFKDFFIYSGREVAQWDDGSAVPVSSLPFGTKLDWILVQVSESVPVRMKRHSIVTVSDLMSPILQRFKFLIYLKMQIGLLFCSCIRTARAESRGSDYRD